MKQTINGQGRLKNGQIHVANLEWLEQTARETYEEGSELEISIKAVVPSKTREQNAYFHGVIIPIYYNALMSVGENTVTVKYSENVSRTYLLDEARAKERLKAEINLQRLENGQYKAVGVSQANKRQMSVLIEASIIWLRENFGIEVPPPDPNWRRLRPLTRPE